MRAKASRLCFIASSRAVPSTLRGSLRTNLLSSASPPGLWHVRQCRRPTFDQTSSRKCASTSAAHEAPVYGFFSSARTVTAAPTPAARRRTNEREVGDIGGTPVPQKGGGGGPGGGPVRG